VWTIVDKLGYQLEEVHRQLQDKDSFVSKLYARLLDEEIEEAKQSVPNTLSNIKTIFANSQTSLAGISSYVHS